MGLKVLKFGGSSLADAAHFRIVADIVNAEEERRFVVPSAPGKRFKEDEKVTDLLYRCHDVAAAGGDISAIFDRICARYNDIISELGLSFSLDDEFAEIKRAILDGAGSDYAASRGEYLNGLILSHYLGYDFIDAKDTIFFTKDGALDSERTYIVLGAALEKHPHAVIPGFYGVMPDGSIKTFSRGGSDITGAIVARAAMADLYENWTDVSGFMMADPRCIENPKSIDIITYKELRELSYMGATVLHEDAVFPVRAAGIPINIKNTNDPAAKGTLIVPSATEDQTSAIVTGIAGKVGFSIISIEKDMMNSELGFGRRVLEVLEVNSVNFEHLPSSIDSMCVIVKTEEIAKKRDKIMNEIFRLTNPDAIVIEDGIALLAVVGRGMVRSKGTAARIFAALANASINIRMIDQGSSELNIIIGVDESDYISALRAIYNEFDQ